MKFKDKYSDFNNEKGKKNCIIILLTLILVINCLLLVFSIIILSSLFKKQFKVAKENEELYNFSSLNSQDKTPQHKIPSSVSDEGYRNLMENSSFIGENKYCISDSSTIYDKSQLCLPHYKLVRGRCIINYSIKAIYHSDYKNENVNLIYRLPSEIIEMTVDDKKVKPSTSYTFPTLGYHTVYFLFDLSNTTSLSYMFYSIEKLSQISFTPLFDSRNITDISHMFHYCKSLKYIDLYNFNTIKVENMNFLFQFCESLTSIDLSMLNTKNVITMYGLLSNNPSLKNVNLNNLNTEKVENMGHIFAHDISLTSLHLNNFNTTNVKNMWAMFYNLSSLHYLDISNFNTEKVTNATYLFAHCINLSYLDISSFRLNTAFPIIAGWKSPGTIRIHSSVLSKIRSQIPSNWHIIEIKS